MNGVAIAMRKTAFILAATALFAVLDSHQSRAEIYQHIVTHAEIQPILFPDGQGYQEITCHFTKGGKAAGPSVSFFSQQQLTPEDAQAACLQRLQAGSK